MARHDGAHLAGAVRPGPQHAAQVIDGRVARLPWRGHVVHALPIRLPHLHERARDWHAALAEHTRLKAIALPMLALVVQDCPLRRARAIEWTDLVGIGDAAAPGAR